MSRSVLTLLRDRAAKAASALARRLEEDDAARIQDERSARIWRAAGEAMQPADELTPVVMAATDRRSSEEVAYVEQFSPETEAGRLRRRCDEYFAVIEQMEKERDALWKMYRESVAEHMNAQALLERHLMTTRRQLGQAIVMLNKLREKEDVGPIKAPSDLEPYEGEPVGVAKEYVDKMIALCHRFPTLLDAAKPRMTDGKRERERVDEQTAD